MIILVLGLATYYLTLIINEFDGPFSLFYKSRDINMFKVLRCFTCLSIWVGGFLSFLVASSASEWLLYSLACAGIATLLDGWND